VTVREWPPPKRNRPAEDRAAFGNNASTNGNAAGNNTEKLTKLEPGPRAVAG
jgi:hypothetical protein